ncbi:MAG: GTP cyclohydrolase MptA, partial [Candidatus Saliniplasma sp.]
MCTSGDVQNMKAEKRFKITRVGVTGVKKPIVVHRPWGDVTLNAEIDVYVDLPSKQKGSHMSRNVEVTGEVVDKSVREPVDGLENLTAQMCEILLERHEYATYSEVEINADYFLEKKSPKDRSSLENYTIKAKAEAVRGGELRKYIGVTAVGMNACPCAMETVKNYYVQKYPELEGSIDKIPFITHNQRNKSTVMMEVPDDEYIEVNDLIGIIEDSLSSSTHEILKRDDEAAVVIQAHENPKFVEDVVRDILSKLLEKYDHLPDSTHVDVKSESEESIHKHNAFAERVTTFG